LRAGASHSDIAAGFLFAPERLREEAAINYFTILGRDPSPAELDYWVGVFQSGARQESVEAGFLGSPEFFARAGGTNTGFVTALYRQLLGRTPSTAETNYYLNRLVTEQRPGIAVSFVSSPEFRQA